jgi:MraZ protein
MFHGTFPQTIDSKGRVSIPAKFREVLNHLKNQNIMMAHFTMDGFNCIDVYPIAEWEQLAEKIQNQNQFDPNLVWFQTFYVGGACDYEVDPQGRILIPPALRDEAGLKRNIVLSGALKKFRIFDREAYDLAKANAKEKLMSDPSQLKNLGF